MPRLKSIALSSEPALDQIRQLGGRLRGARIAPRLRQVDVCEKVGLSRSTLEAIERGEPATAIGAYVALLWLYGLNRELDLLADPGLDSQGLALQYSIEGRRVRPSPSLPVGSVGPARSRVQPAASSGTHPAIRISRGTAA